MSNTEYDAPHHRTPGLFLPFILLAVSVLFSLLWQIANVQAQRGAFKTTKVQVADAIQKRQPQVAQSIEIKSRLEALASDLLELAKTDQTAQAIVKKYDIQRNLPANSAAPAEAAK